MNWNLDEDTVILLFPHENTCRAFRLEFGLVLRSLLLYGEGAKETTSTEGKAADL